MSAASPSPDSYAQRDAMDAALIRLYRATHDRRRLEKLVERFRPLVRSIAARYTEVGEPFDDVMQVALLGLVKAIERYEPRPGSGFGGFARPTIDGEIKRHLRDHGWAMKVPRSSKELWIRVREARREHPTASDQELATLLGVAPAELRDADANRHALRTESIDVQVREDADSVAERLGDEETGYLRVDDRDEIERALSVLEPRDREVVRLRYFDEALQREIGNHIGTSQMQISRILNRSLEQMREHLAADTAPHSSTDGPSVSAS